MGEEIRLLDRLIKVAVKLGEGVVSDVGFGLWAGLFNMLGRYLRMVELVVLARRCRRKLWHWKEWKGLLILGDCRELPAAQGNFG